MATSLPGIKDSLKLPFRTIRIGTLRTFPAKDKDDNNEPMVLSDKGLTFPVSLRQDGTEKIKLKMSAKRIECVHAFLSRGCPVLWIKPDKVWAERARKVCGMDNDKGPYIDPEAAAVEEHELAIITSQDPLPFAVVHTIKHIFQLIAKHRRLKLEKFYIPLQHKENNEKLVKFTVYMEKMDHHRVQHINKQKKKGQRGASSSDSDSSESFSDSNEESNSGPPEESSSARNSTKLVEKAPLPAASTPPRNSTRRVKKKSYIESTSSESEYVPSDSDLSNAKSKEKSLDTSSEKLDSPNEKKRVTFDDNSNAKPDLPGTSPSTSDPPRKVHRARKSIPNRHRTVSIESQLRARIEEQLPKESPVKRGNENQSHKRKHDDESDSSDVSSRPSESDTVDLGNNKKKKQKDNIGMPSKKKAKKSDGSCSRSVSPLPDITPRVNGRTYNQGSGESAASRSGKILERKTQALSMHMRTLRQDHDNLLQQTPLCTCVVKSPHNLRISSSETAKCMAMDHIDGRLYGCFNDIRQPEMFRPSNKVPVLGLCDEHRERMIRHESCPGCGTFCSGGSFLVCSKNPECPHRFHRDCMILSGRHGDCPHCGGSLSDVREVNLSPGRDMDLMWLLAGHKTEKMKLKKYVDERGKSARMGHKPLVQLLPERIPGITVALPSGITVSLTTMIPGNERTRLESIVANFKSDTSRKIRFQGKAFLQSVADNDVTKMLQMLSEGFDFVIHKPVIDTAFRDALSNGDLPTIHILVQAGADVNMRYENGDTPLFRALHNKNKKLTFYLLVNKADIKAVDEDGMTPLHRCAMDGDLDGCHLLMLYGKANLNSRSEDGYTPIMWAAEYKQTAMAKYLAHYGADLSLVDNEGNLCLHWAALSGDVDILLMCLQRHSNPNHGNVHGDTALHIAAREGNYNCISLLLLYGADSTIRNNEQQTAIDCTHEQNTAWMMLRVNEWIRKAGLIDNRILPLNRERVLSEDLSRGYDKVPVICVNAVDNASCPSEVPNGFHYVTENVHTSPDTNINRQIAAIQSCRCTDGCSTSGCNCGIISEGCWYADDGTLQENFDISEPPLVFECNQMCKCNTDCRNRVVQKGIKYRLQVYRTVGMGWGVRALETIPKGAFVCDYVGELISDAEADNREDDSYLFDLENKDGEMYCIDARNYGNVSRFINHLCEPNLVPIRVFVEHHDIRFPKLAYFTTREIKAYEELGFDYGDRFWDVKSRQFTCQCGAAKCKYSAEAYRQKAAAKEGRVEDGSAGHGNTV